MKKYVMTLCVCLFAANISHAEDVDLLFDEMLSEPEISASEKTDAKSVSTPETDNEQTDSFLGFIIKPISQFFSSGEKITDVPKGEKESPLDKSIRLAQEGSLEDQTNLAYMYLYGINGIKASPDKAFKYYEMAAKQNDPVSLNNLGSLYFNGIGTQKNVAAALKCFQQASDLGNDNASLNLAFIYLTGGAKDTERNKKAVELFEKAQKAGNKTAEFMLGYAYYKGFVVENNYAEAYKLIKSAAGGKSQIDEAQLVLANMYTRGLGTVQNYNSAKKAYLSAVKQGNMDAILTLAEIYSEGKIIPQNLIMAHALYNIAAAQNVQDAADKRDELSQKMEMESLMQAQQEAQNFKAAPSELTTYIRQTYGYNIRSYIDNNMPNSYIK